MKATEITKESFNELMKNFFNQRFPEMSKDEATMFLNFCFIEKDPKKYGFPDEETVEFINKNPLCKIIKNRLKYVAGKEITDPTLLFLCYIINTPGKSSMMTAAIYYRFSGELLDMEALANVFPFGFPSEDQWNKLWDNQKVVQDIYGGSDNMLDYSICYKNE